MLVVDFGGGTLDVTKYNLTNDYKDGKQVKVIKAERFTESKLGFDNILDSIRKDLDAKGYALELNQDLLAILNEKELFTMSGNINFEALKSKTLKPYIAIKVALYKFMNEYNANSTTNNIPVPNVIKQEEKQVEKTTREAEKEYTEELVEKAIDEIVEEEIVEEVVEEIEEYTEPINKNESNNTNMAYVNKFKTSLKHKSK